MQADAVKEIQGLYGPFTLTERVVQKIWLRQDFNRDSLQTVCGKRIEVTDPGRWNLLEGPDFKGARIAFDGVLFTGDVEVHFSPSDWHLHHHEKNPNFDGVLLHVVLYPAGEDEPQVKTMSGTVPPVLVLLPLLERDLEAYATDEALLEMEKVEDLDWLVEFLGKPAALRKQIVADKAAERWRHKARFARKRLEAANWTEVCHQMCLEVLGYSRNRAPMSRIALEYPIESMASGEICADALYESQVGAWKLSGLRPVNHPKRRLAQYLELLQHAPEWPLQFKQILANLPELETGGQTSVLRRHAAFKRLSDQLRLELFGGLIGEKRFHTMMVDAFLPLAHSAEILDAYRQWLHWWGGDHPHAVGHFLKHAELTGKGQPLSNGLVQGALALFLKRGV
ncbi:MAG: DUF2851 family protein [Opitutaceae bacterium]